MNSDPAEKAKTLELLDLNLFSSITAKYGMKGCPFRLAKILFKNDWRECLSHYVGLFGFADEIELVRSLKKIRLDHSDNELWTKPIMTNDPGSANIVAQNRIISLIERTTPRVKNLSRSNPPQPIGRRFFTPRAPLASKHSPNASTLNGHFNNRFNNCTHGRRGFSRSYYNSKTSNTGSFPARNFNSSKSSYNNSNNNSLAAGSSPSQMALMQKGKVSSPEQQRQVRSPTFGPRSLNNTRNMNTHSPAKNSNLHHYSGVYPSTPFIKSEQVKGQDEKQIGAVVKESHLSPHGKLLTPAQRDLLDEFDSKLSSSIRPRKRKDWTTSESKNIFWNDWKKRWDFYMKELQFKNELDLLRSLKTIQLVLKGGIYYLVPIITKTDFATGVNARGKPVLDNNAKTTKVTPRFDPPQQSLDISTIKTSSSPKSSPTPTMDKNNNNFDSAVAKTAFAGVNKEMPTSSANELPPLSVNLVSSKSMIKQEVLVEEHEEDWFGLDYVPEPVVEEEKIVASDADVIGMDEVEGGELEFRTLIEEFNMVPSMINVSSPNGRSAPPVNPFAAQSTKIKQEVSGK